VGEVWRDARVEVPHAGRYENVLTGASLDISGHAPLREVFRDLPVALLIRVES
jgi:maltooligosyltrehalose synthase